MLQYKIDSDVRLDGRPCYVQEVRELPEETAHDEAPQHTARVRLQHHSGMDGERQR